ncbi:hypothetical protein GQ43DRAFT_485306 [Delitschia confertaspora ATCC 74209]|uniref:Carboxymuconolactone decarboxylase-like domain-containing protein n=1 Tax=Delitschia confertaspora ATCC 74209 TaxID=1513339 RepID=A0A9P4JB16_9PLEO|nr:hypothetical protein GQ43DRAFT_485306 [Delitschia confertaspora ATCC 74209]
MPSGSTIQDPTKEEGITLFKAIEHKFPSEALGDDTWYLVTLAALVGGGQTDFAPTLYTYLISRPKFSTTESRRSLLRRLRETLVKLVSIIGVCRPLEAVFLIDGVTGEDDRDYSFSREGWQADEKNLQRGKEWFEKIYRPKDLKQVNHTFAAQKDFEWITNNLTYGLYLSDRSIINDLETELVVLTGIMIQNLPRETGWHLRGSRRIGVGKEDLETVHQCIEMVADFCGLSLGKLPRVGDIEHEV